MTDTNPSILDQRWEVFYGYGVVGSETRERIGRVNSPELAEQIVRLHNAELDRGEKASAAATKHICGASGFGYGANDRCPACDEIAPTPNQSEQ